MYKTVVIGVSAGGMDALRVILSGLPASFPASLVIVQHIAESSDSFLAEYLNHQSLITIKEAEDKESLNPGTAYLAPPGYHVLIEQDGTLSLATDPKVNFSCPSIDVLFESAADAFGRDLIGVILTGANGDGSAGLKKIKTRGGLAIVQNPETAEASYMPQAALKAIKPDYVVDLDQIGPLLQQLNETAKERHDGTGTYR